MTVRVGVVGGTGFYAFGRGEPIEVETPYGQVRLTHRTVRGRQVFFLPRHGERHDVPPHRINARAQVRALADAHVDWVLGVFNVGAVDPDLPGGAWVVPHDLIDFTRQRASTFHDDDAFHADPTEPFCPHARTALLATGPRTVRDGGVYAATEGPRFETRAERRALRLLGAHVAGMTGVPEIVLAREAGLCYGAACFVANGAGEEVTAQALQRRLASQRARLRPWLEAAILRLPERRTCDCRRRGERGRLGPVAA